MNDTHTDAEDLALYFRGLLDDARSAALEAHCAACETCADRLRAEARVELALYDVAGPELLAEVARPPLRVVTPLRARARRSSTLLALAAIAAGAFALVRIPALRFHPSASSQASTTNHPRTDPMRAQSAVFATLMNLVAVPQAIACPSIPGDTVAAQASRARAVQAGLAPLPPGWLSSGSHAALYAMGVDGTHPNAGRAPIALGARPGEAVDKSMFGTAMTRVDATPYQGKRVRFSGMVRADAVTGSAGLWMRVDGATRGELLAFDNMGTRPICGTSEFAPYEVVLDVDPAAGHIAYGVLLSGSGQVWLDTPRLEVVDASVPTTAPTSTRAAHTTGVSPLWTVAGSDPADYVVRADGSVHREGASSLSVASKGPVPAGQFGTAMQSVNAEPFRGTRVRLSADVKIEGLRSWAGLWMRVDGPSLRPFDNMENRPLSGTADWARYAIVMDVPADAKMLALGALVDGEGRLWVDDVVLETVTTSVPTTSVNLPDSNATTTER